MSTTAIDGYSKGQQTQLQTLRGDTKIESPNDSSYEQGRVQSSNHDSEHRSGNLVSKKRGSVVFELGI